MNYQVFNTDISTSFYKSVSHYTIGYTLWYYLEVSVCTCTVVFFTKKKKNLSVHNYGKCSRSELRTSFEEE